MMISLQEKTTQAIRLATVASAVCIRLLTCNFRNLSFVCLISNRPHDSDPQSMHAARLTAVADILFD